MDNIWIKSDKQCSLFWSNIAYFTPNMTFSGVETFDWHKSSSFEIRNSLYVSQWGESDAFTSCDHVNSQISISIQTYNWSQTSQRLHHLKVSFWQFLNFAGLFGVWSSLWLYHTQSQKLMFFLHKILFWEIYPKVPQYIFFSENRGASFTDEVCRVLQKSTELVLAACYACLLESHDVLCSLVGELCCLCKLWFSGHSV